MKVTLISAALLLTAGGFSAPQAWAQDAIPAAYKQAQSRPALPLNLRRKGQNDVPRVKAGLQVEPFAKISGDIRGMAVRENGDILVLDGKRGQISVLTDRDKDGRLDMTRKLPVRFDRPVSMAMHEDQVYVVDRSAVWKISGTEKKVLAPLSNVKANLDHRPLIVAPQSQYLYLGLSHDDGTARVVAIDRSTGEALPVAKGEGQIRTMAQAKGTALWLGLKNAVIPVQGEIFDQTLGIEFPEHISVNSLYLPTQDSMKARGVNRLGGQFLVGLGQDQYKSGAKLNGRQLVSLKSAFGQPSGAPQLILGGFMGNHGRSSWGEPGEIAWDERGLFAADRQSGTLWRISQLEPKIRIIEKPKEPIKFYESEEIKKPKAKWGSSIEQASSIVTGSSLTSTWEESKLIPKETLMEQMRKEEKDEDEEEDKKD